MRRCRRTGAAVVGLLCWPSSLVFMSSRRFDDGNGRAGGVEVVLCRGSGGGSGVAIEEGGRGVDKSDRKGWRGQVVGSGGRRSSKVNEVLGLLVMESMEAKY